MKIHGTQPKLRTLLLLAALLAPTAAMAQNEGRLGQGYVFGSVSKETGSVGVRAGAGVGFERLFYKGLGVGVDVLGYGASGYGGLVFTANGTYHFRNVVSSGKFVPIATAGYSAIALCGSGGCGGLSGFNFGGGMNYWFKPNRGLRLEVRDHVYRDYSQSIHTPELRVGFSF